MLRKFFMFALVLSVSAAFGQGSLSGTVTDAKTGEPIIGANVVIQSTTTGTATDLDGKFLISNIAAGTYNIQVSYVTYKTHVIPQVVIEDAKRLTLDVQMSEDVSELQEVVVHAARQTDTDFDLLRSIKESKVIAVVSPRSRFHALSTSAAQVLRRVPGITIKGDQFIADRGLSGRTQPFGNVYTTHSHQV